MTAQPKWSELTEEQMRNLPLDPDPVTREKDMCPSIKGDEVTPNTYSEARLLFGAAKFLRGGAERRVEACGKDLDSTMFDEETMRTGKNFNVDHENTLYSMWRQMEYGLSRVMWGFLFSKREGNVEEFVRDPKVQDMLGFARLMLRGHVSSKIRGLDHQLNNLDLSDDEAKNLGAIKDFFVNVQQYLGPEMAPEDEAADAAKRYPTLDPMENASS